MRSGEKREDACHINFPNWMAGLEELVRESPEIHPKKNKRDKSLPESNKRGPKVIPKEYTSVCL